MNISVKSSEVDHVAHIAMSEHQKTFQTLYGRAIGILVLGFAILSGGYLDSKKNTHATANYPITFGSTLIIFGILYFFGARISKKKTMGIYDKYIAHKKSISPDSALITNDEEVRYSDRESSISYRWSAIESFKNNDDVLLLYPRPVGNFFIAVSKKLLTSSEASELLTFCAQHLTRKDAIPIRKW